MVEDIAASPQEWLGMPTCTVDIHATMFPLDPHHLCGFSVICGELVCWCVQPSCVFVSWLDDRVVFGLALASLWNTVVSGEQGGWGRSGRAQKRAYMGGQCHNSHSLFVCCYWYVRQGLFKVEDGGRTGELSGLQGESDSGMWHCVHHTPNPIGLSQCIVSICT